MISIKGLVKSFGKKEVLKSLDFTISTPGIYAIVGKNGAGKTTLFEILSGIIPKDKGSIKVHNDEPLGYLATDQYFYPRMTGKEYLELCLHARKLPVTNFDKFNSLFDLPLDNEVRTYSSGMKKKLGILGLLAQENKVMILDEPYNGLDIESVLLVGELINKLAKTGTTIILSSHILSSITDITNNLYFLDDGLLIDYTNKDLAGLKKNLLAGGKLQKLDELF